MIPTVKAVCENIKTHVQDGREKNGRETKYIRITKTEVIYSVTSLRILFKDINFDHL